MMETKRVRKRDSARRRQAIRLIAAALGLTTSHVRKVLAGTRENETVRYLYALASTDWGRFLWELKLAKEVTAARHIMEGKETKKRP